MPVVSTGSNTQRRGPRTRGPLFVASALGGRRRLAVVLGIPLALSLAACGGDEGPSAERFCGEVVANKDALTNPAIAHVEDIEPVLDLYREIGDLAPIGISEEWDALTAAYETASTVVPGNVESEQAALAAIYSTEASAAAIGRWLQANCAVDIGPVFTIVPHAG